MKKKSKESIKVVTATTLFDGHDASINIIRRLLQQAGAEVVHLGHNRSAKEIVYTAIQEGAQAIAASSYQGGHLEFFKYMRDLLVENGAEKIKIFGGGGGVITEEEIQELEKYGITKIYSPQEGQKMGLVGMIDDILNRSLEKKKKTLPKNWGKKLKEDLIVSDLLSLAEEKPISNNLYFKELKKTKIKKKIPVLGITGTGGSGKSSLEDEFIRRLQLFYPEKRIALLAIDPTRKRTGGALLGDRIRMNFLNPQNIFMRSLATKSSKEELFRIIKDYLFIFKAANFDLIMVETPGIGQEDISVTEFCDASIYVMTSEFGAPSQLEKIDMLDFADFIVINKFDHQNSEDALKDVRKQYQRNHNLFNLSSEELPIFGTVASNFNDPGLDLFFEKVLQDLKKRSFLDWDLIGLEKKKKVKKEKKKTNLIEKEHYLSEISDQIRSYQKETEEEKEKIKKEEALKILKEVFSDLKEKKLKIVSEESKALLEEGEKNKKIYSKDQISLGEKKKNFDLFKKSLAGSKIPKISLPKYTSLVDFYIWLRKENFPGFFPYTAGVFPFRREGEDPKRQFAGEGLPERTNKRFHFLSKNDEAKRLSTAFDSPTLYGQDPCEEPDIFGKIGESGVSVCTLEDMKKLYAGFDLCSNKTSVSMTINGPAPIMLAFFLNTAIDQQVEKFIKKKKRKPKALEITKITKEVFQKVRGTIQADILKEDQGQNSCIFRTDFALKMMGDIQEFFIKEEIKNFYSVSISGYHIAEAGANPITQVAFTLANAFTYVEYYLKRGMKIDDFAPNFSFFFSSGMDPEYNVLIRVARRIWAIAMKYKYGANEKSQRLKCHVQTSGRSLHAQEMQFNDIRTTLQAFMALNDNCNSLHTNSFDEALTTPSEESVRRAMAIQLIIGKEYGLFCNQNTLQGSFIIEELTDLVEEAVLNEFDSLSKRGGVLGAMESRYQRGKIQDESILYEHQKHTGEYPIIGVNTYLKEGSKEELKIELARSTYEEKRKQLNRLLNFQKKNKKTAEKELKKLKESALRGENIFAQLMKTVRVASLGQITSVLYEVGGQYRRNM